MALYKQRRSLVDVAIEKWSGRLIIVIFLLRVLGFLMSLCVCGMESSGGRIRQVWPIYQGFPRDAGMDTGGYSRRMLRLTLVIPSCCFPFLLLVLFARKNLREPSHDLQIDHESTIRLRAYLDSLVPEYLCMPCCAAGVISTHRYQFSSLPKRTAPTDRLGTVPSDAITLCHGTLPVWYVLSAAVDAGGRCLRAWPTCLQRVHTLGSARLWRPRNKESAWSAGLFPPRTLSCRLHVDVK